MLNLVNGGVLLDWDLLPSASIPPLIFILRSTDITLATLRILTVIRGRRKIAWLLAFAQASAFLLGVAGVITHLTNPWNILAYAGGFAVGNVLGMTIEGFFAPGHSLLRIYSPNRGQVLLQLLRDKGLGATELSGRGQEGTVSLILCAAPRRKVSSIKEAIIQDDPQAFVTVENVRSTRGGWEP